MADPQELTPDTFMQGRAPRTASEQLPRPAEVDQHSTAIAGAVVRGMERLGSLAGVPAPPLPEGLEPDEDQRARERATAPRFRNPRTGVTSPMLAPGEEGGPLGILDDPITGGQRIWSGVAGLTAPTVREKAGAASEILRGGLEMATPAMPQAIAEAPVTALGTLAAGIGLQTGTEALLKALKLPNEYAALVSDLIGIGGAGFAYSRLRGITRLPSIREAADLHGRLQDALRRAQDPTATPMTRSAAKAQADALMDGLRRAETGASSSGPAAAAGAMARPDLTPDQFMAERKTNEKPAQQAETENQPARRRAAGQGAAPSAERGVAGERAPGQPAAGDAHAEAAVKGAASGEYFRGDWNIPMNGAGRRAVSEAAQRTAGQFDEIHAGTKDRHVETARAYAATNPQAGEVRTSPAFDPMHMGVHEGEPVTPERLAEVNDHLRNRPEEPIPGVGKYSGSPGEKPAEWSGRLIGAVQDIAKDWKPDKKVLVVTSGRDVQAIRAWAAKGMPADRSLDPDVLTSEWKTEPGQMMRLDPRTGQVEDVTTADKDGIYFARHGETDANGGPAAASTTGPFGPVFHEFNGRPAEAIQKLQEEKTGEVPRVWRNEDLARATNTDGWIGLAWGNLRGGLAHIIDKHVNRQQDLKLEDLAEMVPEMRVAGNDGRTVELESDTHHASVRLDYDNAEKRWLVTAFEKRPPTGESPVGPGSPTDRSGGPNAPPGGPTSIVAPEGEEVHLPPAAETVPLEEENSRREFMGEKPLYLGSGLGAAQPYLDAAEAAFRADLAQMRELRAKRDAALAELERAKATPEQSKFGKETLRAFLAERDMWAARVNQVIGRLRKLVPDPVEQEGLALMRDFKGREQELARFLDGTHPAFGEPDVDLGTARRRIEQMRPAILKALNPTKRMLSADRTLTKIAEATLAEGKRLGFLDSRWTPEQYNPHILHPKGEGEYAEPGWVQRQAGRALGGKMGKYFAFAQTREFPTLLDAVVHNYLPKTINAFDAFTIHGDKFATSRATRLLETQLSDTGTGKYTVREKAPQGWVQLARHSDEFRQLVPFIDQETGEPAAAERRLYVPPFIEKALRPVTDPDYMGKVPLFAKVRAFQGLQKTIELGLSFFHAYTENWMAYSNMGPRGWYQALRADRDSGEFLIAERDFIRHQGTTDVQGKTVEAYKSLQPGSIPTWTEIAQRAPLMKHVDHLANRITEFTFGNLQRRFKVVDYALHRAAWDADHPSATPAEREAALVSIAKEINAVYGGLKTEMMGINRATVEISRALLLAPDWTFSNFANLKYTFERGTPAAKLARMFWIRQMATGIAATQLLSVMFSGRLSKDPTQVYFGKDKEGRDIYQNVTFKGASGDAINFMHDVADYGAVEGLVRFGAAKSAGVPRALLEFANNRDYLGHPIVSRGMNPVAGTIRGAGKLGEALLPVPFTISNLWGMLAGPDAGKYSPPEWLTTFVAGNPPRHIAPPGMHMTRQGLRPSHEKPRHSMLEEIRTGRP